MAEGLWEESGCELPPSFVAPLLAHLRSPAADVRAAAADALALGAQLYPEAVGTALAAATGDYAGQPRAARLGEWPEVLLFEWPVTLVGLSCSCL